MNMTYFVKQIQFKSQFIENLYQLIDFSNKNLQNLLFTFYHLLKISAKLKLTHLKPKNILFFRSGVIFWKCALQICSLCALLTRSLVSSVWAFCLLTFLVLGSIFSHCVWTLLLQLQVDEAQLDISKMLPRKANC